MKTNNGIILVNKPTNYTSFDVVKIISKVLNTKKVGHTGTLDPLATGLMIVCYGKYTKLVNLLTSLDKTYIAKIKLGIKTDTLDITGNVLAKQDFHLTTNQITQVLNSFLGSYKMEVPAYSAIKVNGKKLYEYARNNEKVQLPIKEVNIYAISLLDFHDDIIEFKVKVEKGTYIRSLIRDICLKLNTLGTMQSLVRLQQGIFALKDAYTLDDIKNNHYQVLNIRNVLKVREYFLTDLEYPKVQNGNKMFLNYSDDFILFVYQNQDIALYKKDHECYKCYSML